jgi:hypothetical protein
VEPGADTGTDTGGVTEVDRGGAEVEAATGDGLAAATYGHNKNLIRQQNLLLTSEY